MLVCIYGKTNEDVARLYSECPNYPGQRITWRLASAFDKPFADVCFAPDFPEIEAAYANKAPGVKGSAAGAALRDTLTEVPDNYDEQELDQ